MRFDVVIRRGLVADGTGAGPLQLDVGVTRDRITALGDLSEAHAVVEVDASGKIVAPGFIDTHAHSDMACWRPYSARRRSAGTI
jgi:N-acyl-D-amino-acid deacylase